MIYNVGIIYMHIDLYSQGDTRRANKYHETQSIKQTKYTFELPKKNVKSTNQKINWFQIQFYVDYNFIRGTLKRQHYSVITLNRNIEM